MTSPMCRMNGSFVTDYHTVRTDKELDRIANHFKPASFWRNIRLHTALFRTFAKVLVHVVCDDPMRKSMLTSRGKAMMQRHLSKVVKDSGINYGLWTRARFLIHQ